MQLSVWEKPVDLKGRGDLNRIIEDPPHKRKKDSLSGKCISETYSQIDVHYHINIPQDISTIDFCHLSGHDLHIFVYIFVLR